MQDHGSILYHQFLQGDKTALNDLFLLYRDELYRFVFGYLREKSSAEDVLQNVFFRFFQHRSFQLQKQGCVKAYLYKIAKNESLNALKKRKRLRETSLDCLHEQSARFASLSPLLTDLEEDAEKEGYARVVYCGLSRLKKEYRQALRLRYFQGFAPQKIARVMKKDLKQVYNLLARGKVALKVEIEKSRNLRTR